MGNLSPVRPLIARANLIIGSDGATTSAGSSIGLSNDEDRSRFIALRNQSDLILIGGNTARREPYKRTPIPLYILTHSKVRLQPKNQLAKQFTLSPAQMIDQIKSDFEPDHDLAINLLVEAGPKLLIQMVNENLIDELYLTVNLEKTGDNLISIEDLVRGFSLEKTDVIGDCQFRVYKKINQLR